MSDEIELDEIIRNDDDGIFPNKSEDEHEHDDSLSSLEELVEEKEEPANNGSGFAAQLRKSPVREVIAFQTVWVLSSLCR